MFNAEFYTKENGEKPARDFIESFGEKVHAKFLRSIDLLETNGTFLRLPHSAELKDGIFELRVQETGNIYRVLYFFYIGKRIILTHGFVKKTQKTPPNEIKRAKQYRENFLANEGKRKERKGNE